MMKYYKDNQNNVFAYSDIQTPKDGLTKITEQEALELSNPPPTTEQIAEQVRAERDAKLAKALERIDRYEKQSKTPDVTPDDSEEVYISTLVYAQALRDVPQQEGFPHTFEWPQEPEGV